MPGHMPHVNLAALPAVMRGRLYNASTAPVALTDAQTSAITDGMQRHTAVMERTNARIDEVTELLNTVEQNLDGLLASGNIRTARGAAGGAQNVVSQFLQSDQLTAFKNGASSTGRVMVASGIASLRNAASTLTSDTGGYGTNSQWNPRLGNLPQRRLELLSALPVIPVENAGSFQYNIVPVYTNAAAVQARQGDAKAQADVEPTLITAPLATVAHWMRASQQVIQDASALTTQLVNLLAYGVRAKLENLIVNGPGGANAVDGLLHQASAYASTYTTPADKIGDAISHLDGIGFSASVVALAPQDWFAMASSKAATAGTYLLGSPGEATVPSLWGVPVAIVPSLAAGTALVLDASQAALLDRMQTAVLASREDGSNFTANLVTLLAECRAGLAVFSPSAVLSVGITAAP